MATAEIGLMMDMPERNTLAEIKAEATGGKGIACDRCGCRHLRVRNKIDNKDGTIKRYRVCRNCGNVVPTTESIG
jgi:hypothetical protein